MQQPGNGQQLAEEQNKDAIVQPDPETLNTTDPQDEMKGPVSSLMQGIKENFEKDNDTEPEEKEKSHLEEDEMENEELLEDDLVGED